MCVLIHVVINVTVCHHYTNHEVPLLERALRCNLPVKHNVLIVFSLRYPNPSCLYRVTLINIFSVRDLLLLEAEISANINANIYTQDCVLT